MNHNVGRVDRALRITAGVVLLSAVVFLNGDARWFGLIGLVPLLTGIVGNCPLYSLLGIDTCRTPKPKM
jgi:uncharacterized membrane-anchored protein